MDTEKKWEEFEKNDTQFRKSESVQQDIQQILDTVTQIKTDVDQLKADGPQATGPADAEPSLSAPEEQQPPMAPPMDMSGAAPGGEIPQEPAGDLMAQPEDGAATPVPEEAPAPDMSAAEPQPDLPMSEDEGVGGDPFSMLGGEGPSLPPMDIPTADDQDILLNAAKRVSDPGVKQQLLALVYQLIEDEKEPAAPPIEEALPPMEEPPMDIAPEEILAAAMDANGDGMVSEEEVMPLMRSADEGTDAVKCGSEAPAEGITDKPSIASSDDEKKEDDDKKKKEEPGVNDGLPEKEEDKESTENLPEVTEVKIETTEDVPAETDSMEDDITETAIDNILDEAKEKIKEQVLSPDHAPFFLSTSEMLSMRKSGGSHRAYRTEPVRKAIEWPDTFEGLTSEDKCRLFAKSFTQLPMDVQDKVVTLMDQRLGSDVTTSIFKSEGVDLDDFYESVSKSNDSGQTPEVPSTSQGATFTGAQTVAAEHGSSSGTTPKQASETECCEKSEETEPVQECNGTVQESVAKSAGVGIHIPTVSEMMSFKKSGTSMYTAISREAAEPHGMVDMGTEPEIPSVKEMFARRFGHS